MLPPDSTAPHSTRTPGRVLIVDDEPSVLAVGRAILEAHGYEVTVTSSGSQVPQLVGDAVRRRQRFNVIVLDLTMPGGPSGFEVLEALLKIDPTASVLACSGYFQEDSRDLCHAIGFADVLQKPYTVERLCAAVRRCSNRASMDKVAPVEGKTTIIPDS